VSGKIDIIGRTTLFETAAQRLTAPAIAPAGGGAAVLFGSAPLRPGAELPHISPDSQAYILMLADTSKPAAAQPEAIPGGKGAGNAPAMFHVDGNRYMLLDNRWIFAPEGARPAKAMKDNTIPGWIGFDGAYCREAVLDGGTWSFGPESKISAGGHSVIFTARSAARLDDGAFLVSCAEFSENLIFESGLFILRTPDGGRTWEDFAGVDHRTRDFAILSEPSIISAGGGRFVLLARTSNKFDYMLRSASGDGGATWFRPERTEMQGHPPFMLTLPGGEIGCFYANHHKKRGLRLCVSRDAGESWDTDDIADILPAADGETLRGPAVMALPGGGFLAVFLAEDQSGATRIDALRFDIT